MSFVIFSLPRSRSAWLSTFLGAPGRVVGHDIGVTCRAPSEFISRLRSDVAGTCETGAAFAWPLIRLMAPETIFATVRRPVDEVLASLARFGFTGLEQEMAERDAHLDEIERAAHARRFEYSDLARPSVCADLHLHCTRRHMDGAWWAHLDPLNIQVDMVRQMALLQAQAPAIGALKALVAEMLADA